VPQKQRIKIYKIITAPVDLYECENYPLSGVRGDTNLKQMREIDECIFGFNGGYLTRDWRKVHNEGLHGLLCLRDFVRAMLTDIDGETK
jgi:hypothetical protein